MKFLIILFLILFLSLSFVSAELEIFCQYNESGINGGIKIWTDQNLTEENKETIIKMMETDPTLESCKLEEELSYVTKAEQCNLIIGTLNSKIREKNSKIEKQKYYRTFCWVFVIAFIILLIINFYPRRKNGKDKRTKNRI